jgi:hypothetical protein
MFGLFKKKITKSELQNSDSFVSMFTKEFVITEENDYEFSTVNCPSTKNEVTLRVNTSCSYFDKSRNLYYGCIKMIRGIGDLENITTNYVVEFDDEKIFTVFKFDSTKDTNNVISIDFKTKVSSERGSNEYQHCLQTIKNTSMFNDYKFPPPFVHSIMMYRNAS